MEQEPEGQIRWACCSACSTGFPVYVFHWEYHLAHGGLSSKTDLETGTLYVYVETANPPEGSEIHIARVEGIEPSWHGELIKDVEERLRKAKIRTFYRCISCLSDNAEDIEGIKLDELAARGYKLVKTVP